MDQNYTVWKKQLPPLKFQLCILFFHSGSSLWQAPMQAWAWWPQVFPFLNFFFFLRDPGKKHELPYLSFSYLPCLWFALWKHEVAFHSHSLYEPILTLQIERPIPNWGGTLLQHKNITTKKTIQLFQKRFNESIDSKTTSRYAKRQSQIVQRQGLAMISEPLEHYLPLNWGKTVLKALCHTVWVVVVLCWNNLLMAIALLQRAVPFSWRRHSSICPTCAEEGGSSSLFSVCPRAFTLNGAFVEINWISDITTKSHTGWNTVLFIWPSTDLLFGPSLAASRWLPRCPQRREDISLRKDLGSERKLDGRVGGGGWHGSAQWRSSKQMCFCLGGFPPQEPCPVSTLSTNPLCLWTRWFLNGFREKHKPDFSGVSFLFCFLFFFAVDVLPTINPSVICSTCLPVCWDEVGLRHSRVSPSPWPYFLWRLDQLAN